MSAQVKQFGRNHVSNSQTFFCRLRSTRLQYNHCLIFLLGDVTKGRYFPMTCVPIQELIRPENVWDSALFSGTFLLLVSGSRVFARKFRPVDFFEVTNFDPDVRRCMRCMRFLLLPYESHRKFMEIQVKILSDIYLLTWNAISKSKTPGHFVLGSCCAVCTSPCFCLCWLDYSQVGAVGDMAVSHM